MGSIVGTYKPTAYALFLMSLYYGGVGPRCRLEIVVAKIMYLLHLPLSDWRLRAGAKPFLGGMCA